MWKEIDSELYKEFEFKDFIEAFAFMTQVAALAEQHNHHPRWHNQWNKVKIWLTTHDAGNKVTEKDQLLAKAIDNLLAAKPVRDKRQAAALLDKVKLYADGGSRGNPGPSASGFVIMDEEDNILVEKGKYLGLTTNNQAEYHALKMGLEEAFAMGAREVDVYLDSLLVINQMKGSFKVRNRDLWPVHQAIKEFLSHFSKVTFTHVPRELNKQADRMVNETLDRETV